MDRSVHLCTIKYVLGVCVIVVDLLLVVVLLVLLMQFRTSSKFVLV